MSQLSLKVLKRKGYSRLVFLSCIKEPKSKAEITRLWNLSENARPLYRDKVKNEIDEMIKLGLIKKDHNKLKADITLEEFSEIFNAVLRQKTQKTDNESISQNSNVLGDIQLFTPLINHHQQYIQFLDNKEIKNKYFSEEKIQDFFQTSNQKTMAESGRENFWNFFYGLYLGVLLKTVLQMMEDNEIEDKFKMLVFSLLMSNPLVSNMNMEALTGKDIIEIEDFREMESLQGLETEIEQTIEELGESYPDIEQLVN